MLLLLFSRQPGRLGLSLLLACAFSVLWACLPLLSQELLPLAGLSESLRILSWALFLSILINSRELSVNAAPIHDVDLIRAIEDKPDLDANTKPTLKDNIRSTTFGYSHVIYLLTIVQIVFALLASNSNLFLTYLHSILPAIWISACIVGLACLENVYRGTASDKRAAIKPLCIALAGMFILDFYVFTDTLLFRRINSDIWQARGFFYAFLVPVLAMTVARNPDWAVRIHVSRQAVTSSITVAGTGGYLLATAVAAYLIKFSGVEWANVAQIAFILISIVVLVMLLVSNRLRALLRVNVSKHLFNFKYDYRREWLNFTHILSTGIDDAPAAIVQGLTQIMHSNSGVLWAKNTDNDWELLATKGNHDYSGITYSPQWESLELFMFRTGWIVQVNEYRSSPELYEGLELPDELAQSTDAWLIIPLPDDQQIIGFVIINRSQVIQSITWEDRDLLKTAGQQAAGLLVQRRSQEALTQARQFEAFSKLSAYVIHDLKNILGQQSLIVSNAARHKHKPAFVDDVISTVDNSVNRMQSLLEKLREQQSDEDKDNIDLIDALHAATQLRPYAQPLPSVVAGKAPIWVNANKEKLIRVFGHLVHNAQDATDNEGTIKIHAQAHPSFAIVKISDNGTGMSAEFIRDSLFKPFVSSKGLTGMGIGAYESREYIRTLGGKITVTSHLEHGTVFTIILPKA